MFWRVIFFSLKEHFYANMEQWGFIIYDNILNMSSSYSRKCDFPEQQEQESMPGSFLWK